MRSIQSSVLRVLLLGGLLVTVVGLIAIAAPAMAQQPTGQEGQAPEAEFKEEVVVTGSFIPRPTLEAMSPVSTLEVEELQYRGMTRLEDLLTSLPQVFAAQNSTIANGASGTATVDLRYLGAVRTLVLVDGHRLPPGDAVAESFAAPDINFIPAALVKRVDILTGGASSVYGADAVAGVVNFILDKEFEGFKGGIQFGGYNHNNSNSTAAAMNEAKGFAYPSGQAWDGAATNANVAYGGKFGEGKGHGSFYLDYRRTSALQKNRRDYLNCSPGLGAAGPVCSGSGTWQLGRFLVFDADYNSVGDYVLDASGPGNTFRNRTSRDVFNYGPYNYMQRPDERYAAGGFLNFQWNEHVEGYGEIMFMDDYTDAQIAPSGDFGNTALLNCDNPMLSEDQYQKICVAAGYGPHDMANVTIMRRNVEGGGRVAQLRHTDWRTITGLKGEINKTWDYDAYFLHAEVRAPQSYANDLNVLRLQNALTVDGDRNDPSTWQCRDATARAEGCVPWNIFQIGGVTQAALDYLSIPLLLDAGTKTQMAAVRVTGDLKDYGLAFPSANEGIQVAIGTEVRKESMEVYPDLAYRQGWGSGQGGLTLPVEGSYNVKEAFLEALVPIVQDATWAQDLALELGYRYSEYNISGNFPSWKVQAAYTPVSAFKIRAGLNRATRAPNAIELFTPSGLSLGGSADICAGATPTATPEQCARTGVTAAQYGHVLENPATQYNTFSGGNANLIPEIADTTTVGMVFTGLQGLTLALDYYDINIEDTISTLDADSVIQACAMTGDPQLCNLIHRDAAGTLWLLTGAAAGYTETTNQNIGTLKSEGVDLNVNYVLPFGNSLFSANLIGTYLMKSITETPLYSYDCLGYFGNQCGVPTPKWRHMARFSWETGKAVLSLGWRMVGSVTNDDGSSDPDLGDPGNIELLQINDTYKYSAFHYFDLAASYKIKSNIQFLFGVNNIADKEPPLAPGMQDADYGPGFYGTYDPYGRYIHSSIQFSF